MFFKFSLDFLFAGFFHCVRVFCRRSAPIGFGRLRSASVDFGRLRSTSRAVRCPTGHATGIAARLIFNNILYLFLPCIGKVKRYILDKKLPRQCPDMRVTCRVRLHFLEECIFTRNLCRKSAFFVFLYIFGARISFFPPLQVGFAASGSPGAPNHPMTGLRTPTGFRQGLPSVSASGSGTRALHPVRNPAAPRLGFLDVHDAGRIKSCLKRSSEWAFKGAHFFRHMGIAADYEFYIVFCGDFYFLNR